MCASSPAVVTPLVARTLVLRCSMFALPRLDCPSRHHHGYGGAGYGGDALSAAAGAHRGGHHSAQGVRRGPLQARKGKRREMLSSSSSSSLWFVVSCFVQSAILVEDDFSDMVDAAQNGCCTCLSHLPRWNLVLVCARANSITLPSPLVVVPPESTRWSGFLRRR